MPTIQARRPGPRNNQQHLLRDRRRQRSGDRAKSAWEGHWPPAGPGAARYVGGVRKMNHRSTTTWMQRLARGESPVAEREELTPEEKSRERLVFGLRRLEGLEMERFAKETGYTIQELAGKTLDQYLEHGWLEVREGCLRLTRRGLLISDSLWPGFLRASL